MSKRPQSPRKDGGRAAGSASLPSDPSMKLPAYHLINSAASWDRCLRELRRAPRLALDLEANSLYAYRERICLIQISTARTDYIVDPTVGLDLSGLGALIEDPGVEKVLHSAEYDLMLLKRAHGWQMVNLFDTMWAARILGYQQMGLANILADKYGITLDKRYQKANWCRRPLPPAQLVYAQSDTHFLHRLRDDLAAELQRGSCWDEAQELFAEQCAVEPVDNAFDPDGFWSINGVRHLSRPQQAVLKRLFGFREEEAERQDRPPFKVLGSKTLLELARQTPASEEALAQVYGMSAGQIRRYGRRLLDIIQRAQHDPPPSRPRREKRLPDSVIARYDLLHTWRKKRAAARGVESDVILSRNGLWELAHANPQDLESLQAIEALGPWRRQAYGREILAVLRRAP